MILSITIMEMIVIDFWFFFKIAADAKQKHKSEISVKYISVMLVDAMRPKRSNHGITIYNSSPTCSRLYIINFRRAKSIFEEFQCNQSGINGLGFALWPVLT